MGLEALKTTVKEESTANDELVTIPATANPVSYINDDELMMADPNCQYLQQLHNSTKDSQQEMIETINRINQKQLSSVNSLSL